MDQTKDSNPLPLYRVEQLLPGGMPDYIKSAGIMTKESTAGLSALAFAYPASLEFPINTKTATYLSYAYFKGADGQNAEIERRIKNAAANFGITADLEAVDTALASVKAASAPEARYALPAGWSKEAGQETLAIYPINDREDIEASAHQLARDVDIVPTSVFHKAARVIVTEAAKYGATLPAIVKTAGVDRYPDFEKAAIHLSSRWDNLHPEAKELYQEIVKSAQESGSDDVDAFADMAVELDRAHGVKYGSGLHVHPYNAFYSGHAKSEVEKIASSTLFLLDVPVPVEAVSSISDDTINSHFSKNTAQALHSMRKLASTEPRRAELEFEKLDKGIQKEFVKLSAESSKKERLTAAALTGLLADDKDHSDEKKKGESCPQAVARLAVELGNETHKKLA